MSKPRFYWFYMARKMIMRYPTHKDYGSMQEMIFSSAIEKTIAETLEMPNGEDRMKAVKIVLFDKTATNLGAAYQINYSERTIQNWVNDFINSVGKNAGF